MAELITLSLDGVEKWSALTEAMALRAADLTPVFAFLHDAWREEIAAQFASEGTYYGEAWAPLSPEYARRKRRLFGPLPILIRTGRLVKSLLSAEAPEHVAVIRPDHAVFGTSVPYAKYHQAGTETMPQRRIVKASDALKRLGLRSAVKYILTGQARPGA